MATGADELSPAELRRGLPVAVLIGPPTAGKSTALRPLLREAPELEHFAVRVHFGRLAAAGTEVGRQASWYAARQRWLPDEFVGAELGRWLDDRPASSRAVILEGFPRNAAQAEVLDAVLGARATAVQALIWLDVDDAEARRRVQQRQVCTTCDTFVENGIPVPGGRCPRCGSGLVRRPDDDLAVFDDRLRAHRDSAAALVDHYARAGLAVTRLDGRLEPLAVRARLRDCLRSVGVL